MAALLRNLADFSLAGMHRKLGPDFAACGGKADDASFPTIYVPPDRPGRPGGWPYQVGGPPRKDPGDYSSTHAQVLYVPDQGFGVDRVSIIDMAHHCFVEKPMPPWWGGFRPDPWLKRWQQASGGNPGSPVWVARGMGNWSNCGVIVFSGGLVATTGTCTADPPGAPACILPQGKLPLAMDVTPRNEFALIAVHDVKNKKGQLAVVALDGGATNGFTFAWRGRHPGLANAGYIGGMKLLGFVDLPVAAPTWICAVGNHGSGRLDSPTGRVNEHKAWNLDEQSHRSHLLNSGYLASAGYAVVTARHEDKAVFVDLEPLFGYFREMYASEENYGKTRDQGPGPGQWPYTFEHEPRSKPRVVATLSVREPTAAIASLAGGKGARALVASMDGTIGIYRVGALAAEGPASPEEIARVGSLRVGRNPVCLRHHRYSRDTFLAVSRGDREVCWIKLSGDTAQVTRRLRDRRLVDPVYVEVAETHGIETELVTVCDFKGRKIVNYRCSEVVFATQGGERFGCGPSGKDDFECGGWMDMPGSPFCLSGTNVN